MATRKNEADPHTTLLSPGGGLNSAHWYEEQDCRRIYD